MKKIRRLTEADQIAQGELMWRDRIEQALTVKQIADKYETSTALVSRRMNLALETRLAQTIDGLRAEQHELLNKLLRENYTQLELADKMMEDGTNFGISRMIIEGLKSRQLALTGIREVLESMRKLHGLDAPTQTKTQITVTATEETDALAAILAENERRARELEAGTIDAEVVSVTDDISSG